LSLGQCITAHRKLSRGIASLAIAPACSGNELLVLDEPPTASTPPIIELRELIARWPASFASSSPPHPGRIERVATALRSCSTGSFSRATLRGRQGTSARLAVRLRARPRRSAPGLQTVRADTGNAVPAGLPTLEVAGPANACGCAGGKPGFAGRRSPPTPTVGFEERSCGCRIERGDDDFLAACRKKASGLFLPPIAYLVDPRGIPVLMATRSPFTLS